MIDKIELRLPPWVDFTKVVSDQIRSPGVLRRGLHYSRVLDLRPHGLDALLHYSKRREPRTHKLELIDTGDKPYSDLCALIGNVVEYDMNRLELMRLDLCADVPNIPVSWFHSHARFVFKQRERSIGALKSDVISRTSIETLTAGSRPNVIRVYDKIAELKAQFRKQIRKENPDADRLDFWQESGFEKDSILTRVERQYGGGRLPETVRTFSELSNAASVNPFETIELFSNHHSNPRIEDYDFSEWLIGMRLGHEFRERGMQNFRKWLNHHSNGNAARMIRRYAAFLAEDTTISFTLEQLLNTYRESTIRQLAA